MKLRLGSDSVRFRLDDEDMEKLSSTHALQSYTPLPVEGSDSTKFCCEVQVDTAAIQSRFTASPFGMHLVLTSKHMAELEDSAKEGVSLKQEWVTTSGEVGSCLVIIEKDRLSSKQRRRSTLKSDVSDATKVEVLP